MTAALRSARKQRDANLRVRPIAARDDAAMAAIIRDVFREYGMDKMEGVSLHDPDLDRLTGLYRDNGGHYWVLERDGQVVGASAWRRWRAKSPAIASCKAVLQTRRAWAGHGALYGGAGAEGGAGGGVSLLLPETTEQLKEAIGLYYALGFTLLTERRGNTGHHGCNVCMLKNLKNDDM